MPLRMSSFRSRRRNNNSSRLENQDVPANEVQKVVKARAWRKFRALLASKRREAIVRNIQTTFPNTEKSGGTETILHLCCQVQPPKDIVMLIYVAFPGAVSLYDGLGRAPLHIAAKYGASPDVINFLLEKNASIASVQDSFGQTPLHLACENFVPAYDPMMAAAFDPDFRSIIKSLSRAAPAAVTLEDKEGLSALELAIESESPVKVVRDLQKVSEKHWKAKAKDTLTAKSHILLPAKLSRRESGGEASLNVPRRRGSMIAAPEQ